MHPQSSSSPERPSKFKILRRWRAPRPPTPRWKTFVPSDADFDAPPVPCLSFFEPDTPLEPEHRAGPTYYESQLSRMAIFAEKTSSRHRSSSQATQSTQADTEIDTISRLGSGVLTPWHSPQSFMEDPQSDEEDIEELECENGISYAPLELTLPSPLLSPRWMFPREAPCLRLTRCSSISLSSQSQTSTTSSSTSFSSSISSSLSLPSSTTSRCNSTCESEELHIEPPRSPFKLGWDVDSPVRLHFGNFKRDSGALRNSIIERRLGLRVEGAEDTARWSGTRIDSIRRGG
ncbi:hypothetical protein BU24DRAFT_422127 [Aaosphaeria arxii CBS 175.79]|uniref:Uncharacterized protein n=1 Tax=Aaosphaeria arxii CBS 175.79 TaxID=1450172 RepID=A0A6A5XSE7_9PLEO|nr:uncharacterized protein BU24DRAFT_422127 [Aaosphaeria arxii CBS 175.79]KAF2015826.1 hypothetical protein BU24DRAFT_422127 [Aaosphaeria arxii CBS 175.79]